MQRAIVFLDFSSDWGVKNLYIRTIISKLGAKKLEVNRMMLFEMILNKLMFIPLWNIALKMFLSN